MLKTYFVVFLCYYRRVLCDSHNCAMRGSQRTQSLANCGKRAKIKVLFKRRGICGQ